MNKVDYHPNYITNIENRAEDLAYKTQQLLEENRNLNSIIREMASAFINQGFCFAQKHENFCFDPKCINMCIDCTINYFKDKVNKND